MTLPGGGVPELAGVCTAVVAGVGAWCVVHLRTARLAMRRPTKVGVAALLGGVVVALASGWVALGVVSAIGLGLCLPGLATARIASRRPALLDGLAAWVESIRSELVGGTAWHKVWGRATVPAVLRPLAAGPMDLSRALAMTEAVGGPEAELLGEALSLAATAEAARAEEMLAAVAAAMRRRAGAQREVAATRRSTQVAALAAAGVAFVGMIFVARVVFPQVAAHTYASLGGQVVLGVLCAPMLVGLAILSRSGAAL